MSSEAAITKATWAVKQLAAGTLAFFAVPAAGIACSQYSWIVYVAAMATTLVALAFVLRRQALAVLVLGGAPAIVVSLVPFMVSGTRDAKRAEAEQVLGSVKGQVRVAYKERRGHQGLRTLTGSLDDGGCGFSPAELQGKYFRVRDEIVVTETGATLFADPMPGYEKEGNCTVVFNWHGGDGVFTWDP